MKKISVEKIYCYVDETGQDTKGKKPPPRGWKSLVPDRTHAYTVSFRLGLSLL